MDLRAAGVVFIIVLAVLNHYTEGYVFEQAGNALAGTLGQTIIDKGLCALSIQVLGKVVTVYGINFPVPGWISLSIAVTLAGITIFLLEASGTDLDVLDWLLILGLWWAVLVLAAIHLIKSLPECIELYREGILTIDLLQMVGAIGAPYLVIKFLRR